jgi:hypothetical protein
MGFSTLTLLYYLRPIGNNVGSVYFDVCSAINIDFTFEYYTIVDYSWSIWLIYLSIFIVTNFNFATFN